MRGESDLKRLLSQLSPVLLPSEFVFVSFPGAWYGDHLELEPIASMLEKEGLSLVVPREKADEQGLVYESAFRAITLRVHSSLDAVGLTAAVSAKLAECGVSSNVIAGTFHDHFFVQSDFAEKALAALNELS